MKKRNFLWKFHIRDCFYFDVNKISNVIENKANCEYKWKNWIYNEIVEWNVKQLNYFLLSFLFMWWETGSKKFKLEKKDYFSGISLLGICIFDMFSKQCLTSLEIYFSISLFFS
jgi:hypothetical protein